MEDTGQLYLVALLSYARQLPSLPLENEALEAWEYIGSVMDELEGRDGGLQLEEGAFQLLFAAVGIDLLSEPASAEIVQDLRRCFEEMKKQQLQQKALEKPETTKNPHHTHSLSTADKITDENNEIESESSEVQWVEVLVDALLMLLSRMSHFWRCVVEQVFRGVVHCVTPGAVGLIANVLRPQKSEEIMDKEAEDDSEEEIEAESEEDVEDDDEIDPKLRKDVSTALGRAATHSDDESDVSMSDGEMERVDEALSEVFRTKFQEKASKRDDAKSVVHFKLRVLDMVQVLLQRRHSSPLILDLILPLYHMTRSARNKADHAPLVSRVVPMFFTKLCHSRKFLREQLDERHVHSILQELTKCLYKDNDQTSAKMLTEAILFLTKILVSSKPHPLPVTISPLTTRAARKRRREIEQQEKTPALIGLLDVSMVTRWLSDALHDFLTKKNSVIRPQLFLAIFERQPVLAWRLVERLLADIPSSGNRFRKVQGLEFLLTLLGSEISGNEFVEVVLPLVPAVISLCHSELTGSCTKLNKVAKLVLKVLLKLSSCLKMHNQWTEAWRDSLIGALYPLDDDSCEEVMRGECEKVKSALEKEDDKEERDGKRVRRKRKRKSQKQRNRKHSKHN